MVPRNNRLPAFDIPRVLRFGKRLTNDLLQLAVVKGNSDMSHFACIVSAKIDKRATERNRMRRLVNESVRLCMPEILPGFDCIFIVKKSFAQRNIGDIREKVDELLHKSGVIKLT